MLRITRVLLGAGLLGVGLVCGSFGTEPRTNAETTPQSAKSTAELLQKIAALEERIQKLEERLSTIVPVVQTSVTQSSGEVDDPGEDWKARSGSRIFNGMRVYTVPLTASQPSQVRK